MEHMTVQKAKDLDQPARQWLQRLFGRALQEDEEVTILLFPPHAAPSAADRKQTFHRMNKVLDKAADNMKDVPEQEFDDAVDEATQQFRNRKS